MPIARPDEVTGRRTHGGGQGIGAACARALGEAGATVVVADLLPERVDTQVAALKALGIKAVGMPLDVTRSADVDAVAAPSAARC